MNTYFTILTTVGAAKLANATALGQTVKLTQMAIGDGNGSSVTPQQSQSALIHEVRRAALNSVSIDSDNANWIICEQVIPADVGGFTIREVGIYDSDKNLIAVGNFPATYKPKLTEGSGRTQTIRIVLEVSSTQSMELKIDPSVVLATREYVDQQSASLKSYVDSQDKSYQTAAKSDATKKANQALADAKSYAEDANNLKNGTVASERLPDATSSKTGAVILADDKSVLTGKCKGLPNIEQVVNYFDQYGIGSMNTGLSGFDFDDKHPAGTMHFISLRSSKGHVPIGSGDSSNWGFVFIPGRGDSNIREVQMFFGLTGSIQYRVCLDNYNSSWRTISDSNNLSLDIGQISWFMSSVNNHSYLPTSGALVSRANYTKLFDYAQNSKNIVDDDSWLAAAKVQNSIPKFSLGDGKTTFRLPLIQDFVAAASDDVAIGTWLDSQIQSHTHTTMLLKRINGYGIRTDNDDDAFSVHENGQNTGATGGDTTRPRASYLYCGIKYR